MGILETLLKESTKKTVAKILGNTVEKVAVTTAEAVNDYKEKHKYSFVPFSSDNYSLRNYKDILEELSVYGFTNIALFPNRDLITGWFVRDGEVEKITINGKEKFKKNTRFESDVRIVITYHTFKNK